MPELTLVKQCSPTLANKKTGSLFRVKYATKDDMICDLRKCNQKFLKKGLRFLPLNYDNHSALIYAYRPARLRADFKRPQVQTILRTLGYKNFDYAHCLQELKERLKVSDFPHEIGLFLGYPVNDVAGFIDHHGRDYKAIGLWKAYDNVDLAANLFTEYKRITDLFSKAIRQGFTLNSLIEDKRRNRNESSSSILEHEW
jgi:hypothetical protein